jgi:hypothetical protein
VEAGPITNDPHKSSRDRLGTLFLCLGMAAAACFAFDFAFRVMKDLLIDDAYILLRHSQNFAHGHGLNFNIDEHVEGYSSFFFALWESLPFVLQIDPLLFTKVSGIGLAVGFLAISFRLARHYLEPFSAGLLALSLGFAGNVSYMSVWGLETILYALLFAASMLAVVSDRPRLAGVLTALTAMTRMEAALLAVAIWVFYARVRIRSAVSFTVALLVVFVPYFAARAIYYQAWLPNPYTAKVGTIAQMAPRGLGYLQDAMSFGGFWIPLAFVAVLVVATLGRKTRSSDDVTTTVRPSKRDVGLLLCLAVVYPLYIIRVGGDHYYTFLDRFLVHEYPVYFILGFLLVERAASALTARASGWRAATIRYGLPLALTALLIGIHWRNWPVFDETTITTWKAVGLYLRAHGAPDSRVAVDAAGAIPYYSELPAIDMMGLADRTIALTPIANMGAGPAGHEKHNSPYVLSRKPAWITSFVTPHGALGPDLWNNIELRRNYDLHALGDFKDRKVDPPAEKAALDGHVVPIEAGALNDSGLLARPAPPSQRWGIWKRRDAPRELVKLNALDFVGADGDLNLDASRVTNLARIAATDQSARVRSAAFSFVPGRYRVALTLAADSPDGTGAQPAPRCAIDVVYETSAGEVHAMGRSTAHEIALDFAVTDVDAGKPRTISLTCIEPWHGRLESASISSIK